MSRWLPGLLALIAFTLLGLGISWAPVLAATLSVGFLAGPHNWMEARYLLGRLPGRAGKLRPYFLTSVAGIVALGAGSLWLGLDWSLDGLRLWNAALILWVTLLACQRRSEHPRRAWPWLEPAALLLAGLMWLSPNVFTLALVFGHPLLALLILGRELEAFRRPERLFYPQVLAAVPIGLLVLVGALWSQGATGAGELVSFFSYSGDSTLFVATHTYLELLHYAVWIGALPALAKLTRRESLSAYPLLRKVPSRLATARWFLLLGAVISLVLWWGFYIDFETTRELYFRLAIFHVLVEFPFLIRLL